MRVAFVLAATSRGPMIVNRLDFHPQHGYGVGAQILETGSYEESEVMLGANLLNLRRKHYGDGCQAVDCGANIGVLTVGWAKHMAGWGHVLAIEAQEHVFYALSGNVALNNCFNAQVANVAMGKSIGYLEIPQLDPQRPGSFGSLELQPSARDPDVGQSVDYDKNLTMRLMTTLDSFHLPRLDFLKIDVEGMELDVLEGGSETIVQHKPVLMIEWIKTDVARLYNYLRDLGYHQHKIGMNVLAVHSTDPVAQHISAEAGKVTISDEPLPTYVY